MKKNNNESGYSRRDFLKTILGVGGALLLPQDLLRLGETPPPTLDDVLHGQPIMASESRRGGLPARDRQEVLISTESMRHLIDGDRSLTGIVDSPTDWVTLYAEFLYNSGPIPLGIRNEVRGLMAKFAVQFDQSLTSKLGGGFVGQVLDVETLIPKNMPKSIALSSTSIRKGQTSMVRQSLYVTDQRLNDLIRADDVIEKIVSTPVDLISLYLGYMERTGPIPVAIGQELTELTNALSMDVSRSLGQMRN